MLFKVCLNLFVSFIEFCMYILVNVKKPEKIIGLYFSNSFPALGQRYNGDVPHCAGCYVQHDAPTDGEYVGESKGENMGI